MLEEIWGVVNNLIVLSCFTRYDPDLFSPEIFLYDASESLQYVFSIVSEQDPLLEEQLLVLLVAIPGNDQRWSLFSAAVLYSLYVHVIKITD